MKTLNNNTVFLSQPSLNSIKYTSFFEDDFLDTLQSNWKCKNKQVTASLFIKRWTLIPALFELLSHDQVFIQFKLEDLYIEFKSDSLFFYIPSYLLIKRNQLDSNSIISLCNILLNDMLQPMINLLQKETSLKKEVFYDHIAYRLDYLYTYQVHHPNDFNLLKDLTKENLDFNFETLLIKEFNKTIKIRRSCCLKHLNEDEDPCYTCPHIDYNERIDILKKTS